jgi:hypothetical protein
MDEEEAQTALIARQSALAEWRRTSTGALVPVAFQQDSFERPSRMDAMQQQPMVQAQEHRRAQEGTRTRIE